MISAEQTSFGYRIHRAGGGWAWFTYDHEGAVQAQGWAPHKALAAACVINALARAAASQPMGEAA